MPHSRAAYLEYLRARLSGDGRGQHVAATQSSGTAIPGGPTVLGPVDTVDLPVDGTLALPHRRLQGVEWAQARRRPAKATRFVCVERVEGSLHELLAARTAGSPSPGWGA